MLCDGELFWQLTAERAAQADLILATAEQAMSYPGVGVLASSPDEGAPPGSGQVVTADWLRGIASQMDHLIVGAYDRQGFLVWSPSAP